MGRTTKEATEYGKWIKKRLIDKNMTVSELAKMIGVSHSMVSKIIYGDTPGYKCKDQITDILTNESSKVS